MRPRFRPVEVHCNLIHSLQNFVVSFIAPSCRIALQQITDASQQLAPKPISPSPKPPVGGPATTGTQIPVAAPQTSPKPPTATNNHPLLNCTSGRLCCQQAYLCAGLFSRAYLHRCTSRPPLVSSCRVQLCTTQVQCATTRCAALGNVAVALIFAVPRTRVDSRPARGSLHTAGAEPQQDLPSAKTKGSTPCRTLA